MAIARSKPGTPLAQRIRQNVVVDDNGCWVWLGATNRDGYGIIKVNGRCELVHRVAFEVFVGPLSQCANWAATEPPVLDHLCKNRTCCHWRHTDPVTQEENVRRGDSPVGAIMRRRAR